MTCVMKSAKTQLQITRCCDLTFLEVAVQICGPLPLRGSAYVGQCAWESATNLEKKYGRMNFRRWLNRLGGIPARLLMRIMARRYPQQEYDRIRLVVTDDWLVPSAERFFSRTREALAKAAARSPQAYAKFRKDIHQVLLWGQTEESPYHKFQLAAVVPPRIALEAETLCYAAWLLHTSGLIQNQAEAQARSGEFLASLDSDDGARVAAWLASATEREPR
jgi:hypothetical protein